MKHSTCAAIVTAAVTLTACSRSGSTNASTAATTANTVAGEPAAAEAAKPTVASAGGVQIAGAGLSIAGKPVAFGTPRADALKAISAGMGGAPEKQDTLDDCGPGPLASARWNKGLQVYFQADKFVGWSGAVDLKTAKGIGFGSPRSALEAAYHPRIEQTSLGTEFTTDDGLSGTLESDAKDAAVGDVWAGMTCIAR